MKLFAAFALCTGLFGWAESPKPVVKAPSKSQVKPRRTDFIEGSCIILPGGGNLAPAPCSNIVLSLVGGSEPIATRTTLNGDFSFTAEHGPAYKLKVESKLFEVVQPTEPLSAGFRDLQVELKYK